MIERVTPWESYRRPILPEDSLYVDVQPDLHVPDLLNLTADMLVGLGVAHVFLDFDGTMAANGNIPPVADHVIEYVSKLAADSRFKSFSIATDNMSPYIADIAASIGPNVGYFQPKETPSGPIMKVHRGFYRRILFEAGIWDTPEQGVMIGDSHRYDIQSAQNEGLKTVLVDRMERRMTEDTLRKLGKIK
jgi:predicted HAD superfamily phosphohydrolase YqeG